MLFAEMTCYYEYNKTSVYEVLQSLYNKYGFVIDKTVSIGYKGLSAMDEMNAVVDKMRSSTVSVDGFEILAVRDYLSGERVCGEKIEKLEYSGINCLYYELLGGGFICLRPSGTEPKLKIYYSVVGESEKDANLKVESLTSSFEKLLK